MKIRRQIATHETELASVLPTATRARNFDHDIKVKTAAQKKRKTAREAARTRIDKDTAIETENLAAEKKREEELTNLKAEKEAYFKAKGMAT